MMEWRVRAELSAKGELKLDGALLDGSPVDLLVASVAGCFVKSCHMVQEARGEQKTVARCEVTGVKAEDSPNRVGHIRIAWALPSIENGDRIAKDAKRICTVTNSMSCAFEVVSL